MTPDENKLVEVASKLTRLDILKLIEEYEREGRFDEHVDPINYDNALPVDNFKYINKGLKQNILDGLRRFFIVSPIARRVNKEYQTVVYGRENLASIKRAIVTCNHVDKFDCLVARKALKGRRLYYSVADFNNQKGTLGQLMRAEGILPMSLKLAPMKRFYEAVSVLLKRKKFVLFYPEQAMWWRYPKPRPFKKGAFYHAYKNNVPIIPLFITFKDLNTVDEEGIPHKQFIIHIMPPIYCDKALSEKENIEMMKNKNFQLCQEKYEEFYGQKLTYLPKRKEKQ